MPSSGHKSKAEISDIAYASVEAATPLGFQEAQAMFDHDRLASEFGVTKRDSQTLSQFVLTSAPAAAAALVSTPSRTCQTLPLTSRIVTDTAARSVR